VGEPIRCKLIVGAISSAPPGTFQAKGIKFLTAFIASAPSPKHKVHIQCELEEAGFNSAVLRKVSDTSLTILCLLLVAYNVPLFSVYE
jgi:hypothetical protein